MTKYHFLRPRSRFIGTVLFYFVFVLALSSCKDDKELGLEVQPVDGQIGIVVDSLTVEAFTEQEDSLWTDGRSINLIGRVSDPVFGDHQSSLITQLELSNAIDLSNVNDLVVDSVILSLAYTANAYGDVTVPLSFRVFEVTENLSIEDDYQFNRAPQVAAVEIGALDNHLPQFLDSVTVNGAREAPQLRIPLDVAYMRTKLLESGSNIYDDIPSFQNHLKGLYVTTIDNGQPAASILSVNPSSSFSRMTLYYRNTVDDDTLSLDFLINDSSARYSEFIHDYTVGTVLPFIDAVDMGDDNLYVHSMAGLKSRIDFPDIEDLVANGPIIVNKAEISFYVEDNTTEDFPAHEQLFLARITEDGTTDFVLDQLIELEGHFGGTLDTDSLNYTFNITRHVQELLNTHLDGGEYNYGLFLVPGGGSVNANRTILKGLKDPDQPVTLTISFTPI